MPLDSYKAWTSGLMTSAGNQAQVLHHQLELSSWSKPPEEATLQPMLAQYVGYKKKYPQYLLLFQVGDFYELFFDDAKQAAQVLNIRLTSRDKNRPHPVPMCGVPIHAIDNYIPRLLEHGLSCMLISQVEDGQEQLIQESNIGESVATPAVVSSGSKGASAKAPSVKEAKVKGTNPKGPNGKGMMRREISRIITPGIRFEGDGLDEKRFNYLAAVCLGRRGSGSICYIDVSTGHLRVREVENAEAFFEALELLRPAELIVPSSLFTIAVSSQEKWLRDLKKISGNSHLVHRPFGEVDVARLQQQIQGRLPHLPKEGGDTLGDVLRERTPESLTVIEAALRYIDEVSFSTPPMLSQFSVDQDTHCVFIDAATRRNLELTETRLEGEKRNSLLWHLDWAKTAMGSRLLSEWLLTPSSDASEIHKRHEGVQEFLEQGAMLSSIRAELVKVRDLDRVVSRITSARATPRDLRILGDSLQAFPGIFATLQGAHSSLLKAMYENFDLLEDVSSRLSVALVEDPPLKANEGGIIREGYSADLDRFRALASDVKIQLLELESRERARSGITGLKVKYNNVFGYFIEVTKTHLAKVPGDYERKQTLVNAERFVTKELKEFEEAALSARARQYELERELFFELRTWVGQQVGRIQTMSRQLAVLDVLCSYAEVARERNYCRPEIVSSGELLIEGGRHPVVEAILGQHNFVPNDTLLDIEARRFAILTGPNMGGKSTYLRQVALIQLLAQAGAFVPARSARLSLVDRIFTRIGAADDITRGDSTFMVEMREASAIVRKATPRSLVLIDEIGRGTATSDGLAIAGAIAEWLRDQVRCKTIFATHFHELTRLASAHDGAFCLSVGVVRNKEQDNITFTHRIEERVGSKSYGIEVAKLAGLPEVVLERAKEILLAHETLEQSTDDWQGSREMKSEQLAIPRYFQNLVDTLRCYDPDTMTPLEALREIVRLQGLLKDER